MTIPTKNGPGNKADDSKVDQSNGLPSSDVTVTFNENDIGTDGAKSFEYWSKLPPPPAYEEDAFEDGFAPNFGFRLFSGTRKRRFLSSVCIILTILWLMMATLIATVLLIQFFNRRHVVYGFCGADMLDESVMSFDGTESEFERREMFPNQSPILRRLIQRVTLNPEEGFARLDVPRVGANRPAVFIHDFKQKVTAIVDKKGRRCFVKPLDRSMLSPKGFSDLLNKAGKNYFESNVSTVAEHWHVAGDLSRNTDAVGNRYMQSWSVQDECGQFRIYILRKNNRLDEKIIEEEKNAADSSGEKDGFRIRLARSVGESCEDVKFVEFEPHSPIKQLSITVNC